MKDLALVVADKNMDFAMRGILTRHDRLGIRSVSFEIKPHIGRDGGVRTTGPETLSLLRHQFRHGLLMLDWEGAGAEASDAVELEKELDERLTKTWGNTSKAIVIDPELDAWIWGSDNAMSAVLGWKSSQTVREWLAGQGYDFDENQKPLRPKEAFERLMVVLNRPRSSALYEKVTGRISLARCVDPAFLRLKTTLQSWFPP
jgi:hypothetical protein